MTLPHATIGGMRVQRSFAFVDVKGFTALTELEGDEQAVQVLTAFRSLLRGICARRSVRIAKWLGDGAMLVCVETTPLLAAVLELHHAVGEISGQVPQVSLRSGVTCGPVILMEGDDYIGHCVNVAARMCDLAQGGEALVDSSVIEHLPRWGRALDHKDIRLRGLERSIEVTTIGFASDGPDRSLDPICGLPMSEATAEVTTEDSNGDLALFCSWSCLDIWRRRPSASPANAI